MATNDDFLLVMLTSLSRPSPSVGASTNMLSFSRFQNADGFATELPRDTAGGEAARRPASSVGLVLAAVALALDHDGLDVVQ